MSTRKTGVTRRGLMGVALAGVTLAGAPLAGVGGSVAVAADGPAKRIVVAGGALTEIAYALGQSDKIVGVDTTSIYPSQALKEKAKIGYVRQLSPEGILSLQPDVMLLQEGGGPPEALTLVRQAGVRIVQANEAATEQGVLDRIATVGEVTQSTEGAAKLAQDVKTKFAALAEKRKKIGKPTRVMFILSLQNGRPMVGGAGTSADGMIKLAGGENVASGFNGYKPMTDEAVIEAAPDVILMMSGGARQHSAGDLQKLPALSTTPAVKNQRVLALDGLYLLGFGPRTPDAALEVFNTLYPELKTAG